MNITNNNYQEFFMLYVDNELLPAEKEMVLQFVKAHPELEEEFQQLINSKLENTDICFADKNKLFKPAVWNYDNLDPVRINMLELLDNELNTNDAEALVEKIKHDDLLQYDWQSLQKAHLVAERITYPSKHSLYKKEEVKRIIWLRWAAAAAILFFAWFLWPKINISEEKNIVKAETKSIKKVNREIALKEENIQSYKNISPVELNKIAQATTNKHNNDKRKSDQDNYFLASNNQDYKKEAVSISNAEENERETLAQINDKIEIKRADLAKQDILPQQLNAIPANYKSTNNNDFISTASYMDNEPQEEEYMMIGVAKVSKQKVRSLFRGISRKLVRPVKNKLESEAEISKQL